MLRQMAAQHFSVRGHFLYRQKNIGKFYMCTPDRIAIRWFTPL
jgi:hypothetical protein